MAGRTWDRSRCSRAASSPRPRSTWSSRSRPAMPPLKPLPRGAASLSTPAPLAKRREPSGLRAPRRGVAAAAVWGHPPAPGRPRVREQAQPPGRRQPMAVNVARSPLRVLLAADPFLPVPPPLYGGIERIVDGLAQELRARGHEVGLVAHPESSSAVDFKRHWPSESPQGLGNVVAHLSALSRAVDDFR